MDVSYRPARPEDLEPGRRVVEQAYNELRGRNGLRPVALREPTFQRFAHAEDPTGLWVAEAEGTIIGFAFNWMRQRFWYLAQLFIRPDIQARGIGHALMSRTGAGGALRGGEPGADYDRIQHGLDRPLYPQRPLPTRAALPPGRPGGGAGRRARRGFRHGGDAARRLSRRLRLAGRGRGGRDRLPAQDAAPLYAKHPRNARAPHRRGRTPGRLCVCLGGGPYQPPARRAGGGRSDGGPLGDPRGLETRGS